MLRFCFFLLSKGNILKPIRLRPHILRPEKQRLNDTVPPRSPLPIFQAMRKQCVKPQKVKLPQQLSIRA